MCLKVAQMCVRIDKFSFLCSRTGCRFQKIGKSDCNLCTAKMKPVVQKYFIRSTVRSGFESTTLRPSDTSKRYFSLNLFLYYSLVVAQHWRFTTYHDFHVRLTCVYMLIARVVVTLREYTALFF